jgi:hypothetical protein
MRKRWQVGQSAGRFGVSARHSGQTKAGPERGAIEVEEEEADAEEEEDEVCGGKQSCSDAVRSGGIGTGNPTLRSGVTEGATAAEVPGS